MKKLSLTEKKSNYKVVLACALASIWMSCEKPTTINANAENIPVAKSQLINDVVFATDVNWIPTGSVISKDGRDMVITPPEDYVYVFRDSENELHAIAGGKTTVSCNCTDGFGCDPVESGNDVGCYMKEKCNACEKRTGVKKGSFAELDILTGGYINKETSVRLASKTEKLPLAFSDMFEIDFVQSGLAEFFDYFYPNGGVPDFVEEGDYFVAPENYFLTVINVFGRAAVTILPDDLSYLDYPVFSAISLSSASCSCSEGSCSKKRFPVLHCDSDSCSGWCILDSGGSIATTSTFLYRSYKF